MTNKSWTPDMPLAPGFTEDQVEERFWKLHTTPMADVNVALTLAAEARAATVAEVVALIAESRETYTDSVTRIAVSLLMQDIQRRFGRQGEEAK